jgi:hypothetical protein
MPELFGRVRLSGSKGEVDSWREDRHSLDYSKAFLVMPENKSLAP